MSRLPAQRPLAEDRRALSLAEVSAALGIAYSTAHQHATSGVFRGAFKVGRSWRVPVEAVELYFVHGGAK